ncbi:serine acetyltransferase [Pseudorhodobacter ferrugineus]|uniref:serine acetyltransferase n=1 Tax=Pseudorhodobacter ferrugineus TaxID=77008 RepID=UPI0003B2E83E|nr:serine acetyltransferase [Pseudorhodobacter ferrugineus]
MQLVRDVQDLLIASPDVRALMAFAPFDSFDTLAGALFSSVTGNAALGRIVASVYAANPALVEISTYDIAETTRRNFEPGGAPATLLFSRGVQAIMAHRIAHKLWLDGNQNLALAIKACCGRAFGTDIHRAARIGAGLWLDHGLGFVVGETSVIDEDVSIWHNVTLGSTLNDKGPFRYPHVGRDAVIGAGAVLLGGIKIGVGVNIGAGAIVVADVADGSLIVGHKAQARGPARISFTKPDLTK